MKAFRTLEFILVLAACFGIVWKVLAYLNNYHAKQEDLHAAQRAILKTEIRLREEIIERDIKKDAEARVYYKDIEMTRGLEAAEKQRKEYLEENLERKYDEQRELRALSSQIEQAELALPTDEE